MSTEFKPGQLVAHKTCPERPWVIRLKGSAPGFYCTSVAESGLVVYSKFEACELVPFADTVGRQFDALIHAIRDGDELDHAVINALLAKVEDAHDDYVEWADGQRATEGDES